MNDSAKNSTEGDPLLEWTIVQPESSSTTPLRKVSFEEFREMVNLRKPVRFTRCLFHEVMKVQSATFSEAIEFHECTFEKHVDATDARFKKKLAICSCVLKQSITLESARIDGLLDLRLSEIMLPEGGENFDYVDTPAYLPPPQFRSAKFAGIHVNGDLKADRLQVHGSLDLGHAEIKGEASFKGTRIGIGRFGGRFYIRQATVDGDFELEPAVDDDPTNPRVYRTTIKGSLSIGASILMGRLNIRGIRLSGCLHAITVHIKGRILGDCWKHPTVKCGPVYSTRIGIHRSQEQSTSSLLFQDATVDEAIWLHGLVTRGSVEFESAKIGGSLELDMWPRGRRTGEKKIYRSHLKANKAKESLVLKNARIAANVRLDGAYLAGRISGHNSHIGAAFLCRPRTYRIGDQKTPTTTCPEIGSNVDGKSLSLYGAEIGNNVVISGAKFQGGVRMRYAKIGGAVIGQPWLKEDGLEEEDDDTKIQPSAGGGLPTRIGKTGPTTGGQSLYVYGAHIGGNLCFECAVLEGYVSTELAHIKGSVILTNSILCNASSEIPDTSSETPRIGIFLDKARVDNDVTFKGGLCKGAVKATGCHVLGDFIMAGLAGETPAVIHGKIDLSGAEIIGDLLLRDVFSQGVNITDASVGKLSLGVGECSKGMQVDLRGLKFRDLHVTRSGISQPFEQYPHPASSDSSSAPPRNMKAILKSRRLRVLLIAAVFGLMLILFVPSGWPFYSEMAKGMNVLITIAVVCLGLHWLREYCRRRAPVKRVSKRRDPYVELLDLMPRFDLATYSNIEYWLSNQGDPSKADEVHHAMRERELLLDSQQLPFGRWLWKWLYFLLAGSGTKVQRLLFIHLGVFLVSWLCIFSNPGSVEHPATFVIPQFEVTEMSAPIAQSAGEKPGWHESRIYAWADHNGSPGGIPWGEAQSASQQENEEDVEGAWGPADGFWVALNVQIPLIHLWARDEWEPASQEGVIGCWFGVRSLPGGMQYETLAGLIQAFSYLTIPMVIAAGSRMVKRREPM